jgi:hypothetical protein
MTLRTSLEDLHAPAICWGTQPFFGCNWEAGRDRIADGGWAMMMVRGAFGPKSRQPLSVRPGEADQKVYILVTTVISAWKAGTTTRALKLHVTLALKETRRKARVFLSISKPLSSSYHNMNISQFRSLMLKGPVYERRTVPKVLHLVAPARPLSLPKYCRPRLPMLERPYTISLKRQQKQERGSCSP